MFNQFNNHRPKPSSSAPQTSPGRFGQDAQSSLRPSFLPQAPSPTSSQPTSFSQLNPQSQRAALFDQARQQAAQQSRFIDPRAKLSDMLPGGLTEKQRMDFKTLQITNPADAQKQLETYQRFSDIRYNKPSAAPQVNPLRSRPTNFNGPRPSFGP